MTHVTDYEQLIAIASGEATTSYEQRNAIAELGKLDDQASLGALVGLLSVEDRYLRRDVVKAIGIHGSASAVLALIHCLQDSIENVRRDAATLLGSRNDGRAVEPLRRLLDDKGYAVRHAAKSSLEHLERDGIEPVALDPDALADIASQQTAPQAAPSVQQALNSNTNPKQHPSITEAVVDSPTPLPTTAPPTQLASHDPKPDAEEQQTHSQTHTQTTEQPAHQVATSHASQPESKTELEPREQSQPDDNQVVDNQPTDTTASPTPSPEPVDAASQSLPAATEAIPSSPTSQVDSTFEEEVILAELISNSTVEATPRPPSQLSIFEDRHTDLAVEQLVSPTPPPGFNWGTAQRFNLLFGENVAVLNSLYASLHETQTEAISSEKRFEKALLKHDLVYADLADDLKENTDDANQQLKTLKQVQSEGDSLAASLKRIKRASTGITSSIANFFWPTRTELFHQNAKDLKAKLRQADEASNAASDALSNTRSKSDSINKPLQEAEEELVAASQASTKSQQEVRDVRNAIDAEILAALNTDKSQGTEEFITNSPQSETLRQCITELRQHQVEHRTLQNALFELDSPLNEDKQRFTKAAANIATSVADGFIKTQRTQKVNSNMQCSVAFRAASVSTSPSHRLEGKAQGDAQLNAHYDYQEISWKGEEQLRDTLNEFNSSATQLGSLQALHAIRSTEVASSAYCVKNCVAFIRSELERDFGAQS